MMSSFDRERWIAVDSRGTERSSRFLPMESPTSMYDWRRSR